MKHSVVIVDDHLLIAKAIGSIMSNFEDFEVLYECQNGKELQEKFRIKRNIPAIVLLDISMPIMNGFETSKWLKEKHPNILVLALSMQDDEQSLIKMIKNGARGYLLKNVSPVELENALNTMICKGYYYPDWATNIIFSGLTGNKDNESDHHISMMSLDLSEKEKFFLSLCATDMSYKEISEKMYCSPRTIENYRNSLCEKLNIKTRVGLAVYAIKIGLD